MLVLFRHGQSRRNVVVGSRLTIHNTPESMDLAKVRDHELPLTELGERQARAERQTRQ
jgi:broad specificity phosphatase PhoE